MAATYTVHAACDVRSCAVHHKRAHIPCSAVAPLPLEVGAAIVDRDRHLACVNAAHVINSLQSDCRRRRGAIAVRLLMSSMRRRTERSNGRERERRGPCNDSVIDGAEEEPLKQRPLKHLHGAGPHAAAVRTHVAAWEGPLGSERVGCIALHCTASHCIASHCAASHRIASQGSHSFRCANSNAKPRSSASAAGPDRVRQAPAARRSSTQASAAKQLGSGRRTGIAHAPRAHSTL